MKVLNKHHVPASVAFARNNKAAISAYLLENADSQEISFDKIRNDFPGLAESLTDGVLAEIFKELNLQVIE